MKGKGWAWKYDNHGKKEGIEKSWSIGEKIKENIMSMKINFSLENKKKIPEETPKKGKGDMKGKGWE